MKLCRSCSEEIDDHHATVDGKHRECHRIDRRVAAALDEQDFLLNECDDMGQEQRNQLEALDARNGDLDVVAKIEEIAKAYYAGGGP